MKDTVLSSYLLPSLPFLPRCTGILGDASAVFLPFLSSFLPSMTWATVNYCVVALFPSLPPSLRWTTVDYSVAPIPPSVDYCELLPGCFPPSLPHPPSLTFLFLFIFSDILF